MQYFYITLYDCSELSGLMFTLNILFQIMTPLYRMPVLDKFEEPIGTCKWLTVLYHVNDHVYENYTWKSPEKMLV